MADFQSKDDQHRILEFADNSIVDDPIAPQARAIADETFPRSRGSSSVSTSAR